METSMPPDVLVYQPGLNWKGAKVLTFQPSPAETLASKLLNQTSRGLWIISGYSGSGKSTWCAEIADLLRVSDVSVGGILCLPVFDGIHKVGFEMVDLNTNERRQCGFRDTDLHGGISIGCWNLDSEVLAWGNLILNASISKEVIIIDELGPLEFDQGKGLLEGLRLLDEGDYQTALVVIRPELLGFARQRWPNAMVVQIGEGVL
jgi:nucleoside-triphosphatase THEP1